MIGRQHRSIVIHRAARALADQHRRRMAIDKDLVGGVGRESRIAQRLPQNHGIGAVDQDDIAPACRVQDPGKGGGDPPGELGIRPVQRLVFTPRGVSDDDINRSVGNARQPQRVFVEQPDAIIADEPGFEGRAMLGKVDVCIPGLPDRQVQPGQNERPATAKGIQEDIPRLRARGSNEDCRQLVTDRAARLTRTPRFRQPRAEQQLA